MANNGAVSISVTLDKSKTPYRLYVDQRSQHNEIHSQRGTITVKWHLAGDAAGGAFLQLSGNEPGFAWNASGPPDGVFGAPHLAADGKSLSIVDEQPEYLGEWTYTLRARIDGTVYVGEPLHLTATRGSSDPIIRNK
jgi:hypothetical protein